MKRFLAASLISLALFVSLSTPTYAALTESQIQSILSLLSSFGANSSVIVNVNASLRGQSITGGSSAAPCISLTYNLYAGLTDSSTNGQVSQLQQFLGVSTTGYFGPMTQQAVQNWQSSHGIVFSGSPDTTGYGFVGPSTRAAMACGSTNTDLSSLINAQKKSRDAKRIADVQQLRLALELYSDSNGFYPSGLSSLSPTYIAVVPQDPLDNTTYPYDQLGNGTGYELGTSLEVATNSALQSDKDSAPSGGAFTSGSDTAGCTGSFGRYCYDIGESPSVSTLPPTNNYASITLSSPYPGTSYKVGDSIPISWTYSNAPQNSQIILKLENIAASQPISGAISGGTWQSPSPVVGSGTGSYNWPSGPNMLDLLGTYKITALIRECDPRGCNWNADFPGAGPVSTWATSAPVQLTLASQTSAPTLSASPTSGPATLWVDFNVGNYTPQGNEFVYFGDGHVSALGHTTPTNSRYDYNVPGTYTATLVRNGVTLASVTVTVQ